MTPFPFALALLAACIATGSAVVAAKRPLKTADLPVPAYVEHGLLAAPIMKGARVEAIRFARLGSAWASPPASADAARLRRAAVAQGFLLESFAARSTVRFGSRLDAVADRAGGILARFGLDAPERVLLLQSVVRRPSGLRTPD